jgi:hypothetical protein
MQELFSITLKIEAPELVEAIRLLAGARPSAANNPVQSVLLQNQMQLPMSTGVPTQTPNGPSSVPFTPPSAVPTTELSYTLEQLSVAATPICDAGRRQDIVNLLNKFGVSALTQLPKELYGTFATELRAIGGKL